MNLIFDLDGTLIDSRLRLYKLFQQLAPSPEISYDAYWALKFNKISNETILFNHLGFDDHRIKRFKTEWMALIESPDFLAVDKCFSGIQQALDRLYKQASLHICTARQHRQPAIDQLSRMGLLPYFTSVMVTEQKKGKEDLIAELPGLDSADWIIGDTGKDINIGKFLGIRTCAVLSGFLNERSLRLYHPDLLLRYASDFYLKTNS